VHERTVSTLSVNLSYGGLGLLFFHIFTIFSFLFPPNIFISMQSAIAETTIPLKVETKSHNNNI